MDPLVSLQVIQLGESLTAHITWEGFMTCVHSLVSLHITSPRESLTAYITYKRFMASVDPLVFPQVTNMRKSYVAYVTHVLPGPAALLFACLITIATTTVRSGGLRTYNLLFLTKRWNHVHFKTAVLSDSSGIVLTYMGCAQG